MTPTKAFWLSLLRRCKNRTLITMWFCQVSSVLRFIFDFFAHQDVLLRSKHSCDWIGVHASTVPGLKKKFSNFAQFGAEIIFNKQIRNIYGLPFVWILQIPTVHQNLTEKISCCSLKFPSSVFSVCFLACCLSPFLTRSVNLQRPAQIPMVCAFCRYQSSYPVQCISIICSLVWFLITPSS